jgi:hypothetical protein|tara:strand:- start:7666 stop:8574 length:909 start_codon:yes stop_codon:yes gene_type:complete
VNPVKQKILNQLIYSEIFGYPLTKKEIAFAIGIEDIEIELSSLVEQNLVLQDEEYYTVFDLGSKIENRKKGNAKAKHMLPKALKVANFISKFPYVEGVGISGSLSKGVLMDEADFDFFIITKAQRLWIARTLLILYKKIFLLNSRKFFCVNYFIDNEHLAIEERNLFTATEIATLIPAKGSIFSKFYLENSWVSDERKTRDLRKSEETKIKKPILSKIITRLLDNRFGEWLDRKFMQLTFNRWKRKFSEFDQSKFDLTMKSRPYVSKHHPHDFQNKVLQQFEELQTRFQKEYLPILEEKKAM